MVSNHLVKSLVLVLSFCYIGSLCAEEATTQKKHHHHHHHKNKTTDGTKVEQVKTEAKSDSEPVVTIEAKAEIPAGFFTSMISTFKEYSNYAFTAIAASAATLMASNQNLRTGLKNKAFWLGHQLYRPVPGTMALLGQAKDGLKTNFGKIVTGVNNRLHLSSLATRLANCCKKNAPTATTTATAKATICTTEQSKPVVSKLTSDPKKANGRCDIL